MYFNTRRSKTFGLLIIATLTLSACASRTPVPTQATTSVPQASEVAPVLPSDGVNCRGATPGDQISLAYPWSDTEQAQFNAIFEPLLESCGIQINAEPIRNADTLDTRLRSGGAALDLLLWPNTEPIKQYGSTLRDMRQLGALQNNYASFWTNLGLAEDSRLLALPVRANIKSVIWYNPSRFEQFGYTIPTTPEELDQQIEQMVADGNIPWSTAFENGAVAADLIQDLLLGLYGYEFIDGLIAGTIPYNDARVAEAIERYFGWATDGTITLSSLTNIADAIAAVFSNTPRAMMIKQSAFNDHTIAEQFPNLQHGVDLDFFVFPGAEGLNGRVDFLLSFSDSPAVRALVRYLTGEEGAVRMAESGFGLSLNNFSAGNYTDEHLSRQSDLLTNAPRFFFDLRDHIPEPFGTIQLNAIVDMLQGDEPLRGLDLVTAAQQAALSVPITVNCGDVEQNTQLSIIHPWSGADEEHLMTILAPLSESCGIVIEAQSVSDEATLNSLLRTTPPDILFWPSTSPARANIEQVEELGGLGADGENYADIWFDLGLVDGGFLALPVNVDIESLIWYKPARFLSFGYQIPTTLEELDALVERMFEDGNVPWSMGFEDGEASGALGADFAQNLVLALFGPDTILGLIDGDVGYDDEGVVEAYEIYSAWAFDVEYTLDGAVGTLTTNVLDAIELALAGTSDTMMVRQSNLAARTIAATHPGMQYGTDFDFFPFPDAQDLQGRIDFVIAFEESPATQLLITYLASPQGAVFWANSGLGISPNIHAQGHYSDPLLARQAEMLANAVSFTPHLRYAIPEPFPSAERSAVIDILQGELEIRDVLFEVTFAQEAAVP